MSEQRLTAHAHTAAEAPGAVVTAGTNVTTDVVPDGMHDAGGEWVELEVGTVRSRHPALARSLVRRAMEARDHARRSREQPIME